MMSVWSHRPRYAYLGLFFSAYVLGCGFADALAIVPGITVAIWPPAGVFVATLIRTSAGTWPWWILMGGLAEMLSQAVWFHSPLAAGLLIYGGNALCAITGATLVNWTRGRPLRFETLPDVLAFVGFGAGVAPLVSATVGSAALEWFGVRGQTFEAVWPLFWIGDATGILLVGPLTLIVVQQWRGSKRLSVAKWLEASFLGVVFLTTAALSLSTDYLASAYIIMPPLLWAAVRFEFKGVAVALTLLALSTMALTISGGSHFLGDAETQREKQVMLQLFLAISAFSSLLVAAISRQYQQALLSLSERERELSQLVDMVPVHIRRMTPEGEPIFFNKRLLDFFGLDDVASLDKPGMKRLAAAISSLVHPDDGPGLLETASTSFANGRPFAMKYRMRRADGVYRWVDSRGEPLRDQDGTIVQWYVISIDIDDEMRAQEALRSRGRELAQLVDMVPSLLWRLSPQGEPTFFSKRLIEFCGRDVEEFDEPGKDRLSSALSTLFHPDDLGRLEEALARSLRTGHSFALNYRLRRADGVYRWMSGRAEPLRDDRGHIIQWFGLSNDIEDQVRVEEELHLARESLTKASQVASLAELSAAIAHEVNQPLAAIVANANACRRWLAAEPPNVDRARRTVERIIHNASSAGDVVTHMRALFKHAPGTRTTTTLISVVEDAYNLLVEEAIRRGVRIAMEVEGNISPIALDRVQIQQVLVNLIRNGMDAMDDARNGKSIAIQMKETEGSVHVAVKDKGRGVDTPDKVFDPFYTTKDHGMGMGLAICRSIIEAHGGRLWVENNEPVGSTFTFTLPVEVTSP